MSILQIRGPAFWFFAFWGSHLCELKKFSLASLANSRTVHVERVEDAAVLSTQVFPLVVFDSCPHGPGCCPGKLHFLQFYLFSLFVFFYPQSLNTWLDVIWSNVLRSEIQLHLACIIAINIHFNKPWSATSHVNSALFCFLHFPPSIVMQITLFPPLKVY